MRAAASFALLLANAACAAAQQTQPLVIGETFTVESKALGEARRINVYAPTIYLDSANTPLPVLYMPDGGIKEDFLHVAGLVQVSVGNGTMRPFLLVGIENTQRRRDLTGPTSVDADRKIAPQVGGSEAFRKFIRDELKPAIRGRYKVTDESAIIGESLAGLFVVETFLLEPDLFDTYIAFDPSLWWNGGALVEQARTRARAGGKTLYLAHSDQKEIGELTRRLAEAVEGAQLQPLPAESHATIYHPAALAAVRALFAPGGTK